MILRSHWALEFAFPSVLLLSSHLFVLFLLFQLYEDLYDDNNTPKE